MMNCKWYFYRESVWVYNSYLTYLSVYSLKARATNSRLEKSGFKLDTKEEEAARLSEAFASFSYDSNVVKGQRTTTTSTSVGKKESSIKSK